MKRVFDTSAWIEWLDDSQMADEIDAAFPPLSDLIVPTIVQFELRKWITRERGSEAAERVLSLTMDCKVTELTTAIALSAANFARIYRLSTADAIIYATAHDLGADVLTCDAHFRDLPSVVYLPKPRPDA